MSFEKSNATNFGNEKCQNQKALFEKSNDLILKIKHLLKESNGQILEIKNAFGKSNTSSSEYQTLVRKSK